MEYILLVQITKINCVHGSDIDICVAAGGTS